MEGTVTVTGSNEYQRTTNNDGRVEGWREKEKDRLLRALEVESRPSSTSYLPSTLSGNNETYGHGLTVTHPQGVVRGQHLWGRVFKG